MCEIRWLVSITEGYLNPPRIRRNRPSAYNNVNQNWTLEDSFYLSQGYQSLLFKTVVIPTAWRVSLLSHTYEAASSRPSWSRVHYMYTYPTIKELATIHFYSHQTRLQNVKNASNCLCFHLWLTVSASRYYQNYIRGYFCCYYACVCWSKN